MEDSNNHNKGLQGTMGRKDRGDGDESAQWATEEG